MLYDQMISNQLTRMINSSKEMQLLDDSGLTDRLCIVTFRTVSQDSCYILTMQEHNRKGLQFLETQNIKGKSIHGQCT